MHSFLPILTQTATYTGAKQGLCVLLILLVQFLVLLENKQTKANQNTHTQNKKVSFPIARSLSPFPCRDTAGLGALSPPPTTSHAFPSIPGAAVGTATLCSNPTLLSASGHAHAPSCCELSLFIHPPKLNQDHFPLWVSPQNASVLFLSRALENFDSNGSYQNYTWVEFGRQSKKTCVGKNGKGSRELIVMEALGLSEPSRV